MKPPPINREQEASDIAAYNEQLGGYLGLGEKDREYPPATTTQPPKPPNASELYAREKKARRLADLLYAHDVTIEQTTAFSDINWRKVAEAATQMFGERVHPPNSQATKDAVIQMLREKIEARKAARRK